MRAKALQQSTPSSSPCINWEFANSSCGHALTEARLCKALRCRNMLLVGDSTFLGLFRGLSIYHGAAERQWQSGVMTNSAARSVDAATNGQARDLYGMTRRRASGRRRLCAAARVNISYDVWQARS